MSEVSLIDGHIDDTQLTCQDCTKRHYNCHSHCEAYKKRKESVRKETVGRDNKRTQVREIERYEAAASARRGNFIKGRHK